MNNITSPIKPNASPTIFETLTLSLYTTIPMTSAKMGVSAFNIPASELSILVSAIQKRYAGKKLPNNPESITPLHLVCRDLP